MILILPKKTIKHIYPSCKCESTQRSNISYHKTNLKDLLRLMNKKNVMRYFYLVLKV